VIIRPFQGKLPKIAASAFIADGVVIIGDVEIGEQVSIWYNAVLRADVGMIRIGARSNVQDGSCVHMTSELSHAIIGEDVTVGHNAIVHGATVEDGCLIGMGSILLDNAVIGRAAVQHGAGHTGQGGARAVARRAARRWARSGALRRAGSGARAFSSRCLSRISADGHAGPQRGFLWYFCEVDPGALGGHCAGCNRRNFRGGFRRLLNFGQ
jgi:carbonic anhydrase/acetyltransferase-like protein (isoleucine patch superfamily)